MVIYRLSDLRTVPSLPKGGCAALGNFDGVHIGHRALFKEALKSSVSVVWTFVEPAKPAAPVPLLTDLSERLRLFAEMGLSYAVITDFQSVRELSCSEFVRDHLKGTLGLSSAVCGYNYRFGRSGAGDSVLFSRLCRENGIACTVVPKVCIDGEEISSSRIRELILNGDVKEAKKLLGHPYSFTSPVLHGMRLGSSFSTPTVNQNIPSPFAVPARGVYATCVHIGEKIYPGATNVGVRPTVSDGKDLNCETNIIGFSGDLYGSSLRIDFLEKLRDEKEFSDKDALFSQIKKDIDECARIFGQFSERI